jgi:diaminopimelate decarboxylase
MGNICSESPQDNYLTPLQITGPNVSTPGFATSSSGELFCDGISVETIRQEHLDSNKPFFLYSQAKLDQNLNAYTKAVSSLPCNTLVGYSMKANNNLAILRRVKEAGAGVVVVSANELRVALEVIGIDPNKIVYNGNGKKIAEIKYAIFY